MLWQHGGIVFSDRVDAGRQLAARLGKLKGKSLLVLGIPRGGVEVAFAISRELKAKLGVAIAKKIPAPGNAEFALGAVSFGGVVSLDEGFLSGYGIAKEYMDSEVKRIRSEIGRRYKTYSAEVPEVKGRTVVLVDDGMATGHTVLAAVRAVKKGSPKKVVVAVPVSSRQAFELLRKEADEVICLDVPDFFMAVGEFYRSFPQLTDVDVADYLMRAGK